VQYLVSPRILAAFLALPALSSLFLLISSVGAYFAGVKILHIESTVFYLHLRDFVMTADLIQGLIKAAVFGVMFSATSTFIGFTAKGGARGVGNATNIAVVSSLLMVLVSDYFLTLVIHTLFYGEKI
jgi:phospholipid/cholesterol/gamma-HCH transport system permease protein